MCPLCGCAGLHMHPPLLGQRFPTLHSIHFYLWLEVWVLQLCMCPCSSPQPAGTGAAAKSLPASHKHTKAWVPMCVSRVCPGWAQAARGGPWEGCDAAGQLLAVPHQAVPHVLFLHLCLPGKKHSRSLLHFFWSWPFLWLKSPQANAWLLFNLAGCHLPLQHYQSAGKHPHRQFGVVHSHIQFSSTWACWFWDVWVWIFYHSPTTINDFISLEILRELMDWLQVVIKSLKRDFKLGNFYIPEMRYLNKTFFSKMSQKGGEIKGYLIAV